MSILSIIVAIILFAVVILFHELGHFLLAKANGIRVNEFCLGFGPTLIGFTRGETTYSIKLLPFGGACMMEGEDGDSADERAFGNASVWARISVVAAGPLFNFLMAILFSFFIIMNVGYSSPVISDVIEGYAAEAAGLQGGDEIVKVGGYSIHFYNEISLFANFHEGETIEVVYQRDGQSYTTSLTPKYDEESGRYLYGFIKTDGYTRVGPLKGLWLGVCEVRYWIYTTIQSLKGMVTGLYGVSDMSGPVGIVREVGSTYDESVADSGYWYAFLNMLKWGTLLAANLGVMNLLPIPALDGGRLVFLIIEAIRRKKIDPDKEGMVHLIGFALLFALMIFVMGNDILRIFKG